jgi:hypothetical protein
MHTLNLKPTHKVVKSYYTEIQQLNLLDHKDEGAVSPAFAALLRHCARQYKVDAGRTIFHAAGDENDSYRWCARGYVQYCSYLIDKKRRIFM